MKRKRRPAPFSSPSEAALWLYGLRPVAAALANPRRRVERLVATAEGAKTLAQYRETARKTGEFSADGLVPARPQADIISREEIAALVDPGAVHQGVAALVAFAKGETAAGDAALEPLLAAGNSPIVILDQVTDPRNVGTVLRAAAALGARAVVIPDRHSPPPTPALAKAAAGGLEIVPLIRVPNLARALEQMKERGVWCLGLDSEGEMSLEEAAGRFGDGPVALVMGAEGSGLRRLTRENCDALLAIPTSPVLPSLNVAAAAAISLYAFAVARQKAPKNGELHP